MAREQIPRNATIADVLPTLADQEDYVRRVLSTLSGMRREHGDVVVRIGVTGKGFLPNYRVDHAGELSVPISAFDGATHKPFSEVASIDTDNWSTGSMTLDDVRGLLGRIRGLSR